MDMFYSCGRLCDRGVLPSAIPQSALEVAESLEQLRWLENGFTIKVGVTTVETIGIDTPQDLQNAEEFLKANQSLF